MYQNHATLFMGSNLRAGLDLQKYVQSKQFTEIATQTPAFLLWARKGLGGIIVLRLDYQVQLNPRAPYSRKGWLSLTL